MVRISSIGTICLLLIVGVFNAGCGNRPKEPPTRPLAKPCESCIDGVANFAKVSAALWRGAQPTKEGFRNLEAAGVKAIVNFRHDHDDLPLLAGTQLKYLWVPARAWKPEEQDLVIFLKVLEDPKNWPVFVHCAEGKDRTGYSVAAYRIVAEDWAPDDAIHEMFDFHYNPIWFENPRFLHRLNAEQMRARVKLMP